MKRRRALVRTARIGLVVAVIAVAAGFIVRAQINANRHRAEATALEAKAASAAKAAGCGSVRTQSDYPGGDRDHVAHIPALSSYPTHPPASGPHNAVPLDAGVYADAPPIDRAIHSLEHGAAEIWYAPDHPESQVASLRRFFSGQDHVIVAPYSYPDQGPAGQLPSGMSMALVAWHRIEYCRDLSLAVAADFVAHYRYPPESGNTYKGEAPEAGLPI